jgi:formate-dependent nitrite reductase membrane component NrfD
MQFAISNLGALIPNLVILLAIMAVSFNFSANMAPPILFGASLFLLSYAIFINRSQFSSEYKYSTWQRTIRGFSPIIFFFVVLIAIYGGFALTSSSPGMMLGGKSK